MVDFVVRSAGDVMVLEHPGRGLRPASPEEIELWDEREFLRARVAELEKDRERMEVDAARYRHARAILNVGFVKRHLPDHDEAYNSEVDAAIDAAREDA